jgi:hypothetical protein
VFTNPIDNNLQELQQAINWRYHTSVEYEMLTNVFNNLNKKVECCLQQGGHHFKHSL